MSTTFDLPSGEAPTPRSAFPALRPSQTSEPVIADQLSQQARALRTGLALATSRIRERFDRTAEMLAVVKAKRASAESLAEGGRRTH